MSFALSILIALVIDAVLGWPDALFRRIGHPVTWLGALIAALDQSLNRATQSDTARRLGGAVAVVCVLILVSVIAISIHVFLPESWMATLIFGVLAWPLVAARSLHAHVADVAKPLARGDLASARVSVAMIVGRDPSALDEAGIARAAIESLAENASDGVVAPIFWGAVAGLPGIAAYKAINTLDSMIGHRSERYEDFGKVAARLDDLANLVPARLTALFFMLIAPRPIEAFRVVRADSRRHRSPNAGWPEAAMAGALGVRLSGPRVYNGRPTEDPWVNDGAPDPGPEDLQRGLALFRRSMIPLVGLLAVAAVFGV